ncbi:hypothetical protein BDK92_2694 [Micromonospora pisi]|uniref:TrbL/VirB6 plasmid conjugal transfer protein n=1 Tax=Micromonospora pisi TaxID=589240 RepID=A0A495JHK6_9ACTN|nr:hypothetical protein [Micromonospora pisi]RKR88377.1 hypothetical protein BDK92_2694 [Micromonospora pisi]
MITACVPLGSDVNGCNPGDIIGGIVGGVAGNAWESVCKSFADAATSLLKTFADAFVAFPNIDLMSIDGPYAISKWLAMGIAALLLLIQIIRTAVTQDGSALAQGLVGTGKAVLAFLATMLVANAALIASDEITKGIVDRSLGGNDGLKAKLTVLFQLTSVNGTSASLMLILALVGIALTLVLWFEMLLRNAAIAVLLATSPIAAVGQISETTKSWWSKLCAATIQLIILKPVIAMVFAIGFGIFGDPTDPTRATDLTTLLTGMLILLLAVVAWPVIARFFTFATVQAAAGGGMAGLLGFAAGRTNSGGSPVGVNPAQFSQATEARTMAAAGTETGAAGATGATGAGATGAAASGGSAAAGAGAAGAAGALGAVALPIAVAAAGIDMAQRAVNSLAGRMEQTAGHAGIHGANPHARPAGYPQYGGSWTGAATGGGSGGSPQPAPSIEADRSSSVAADVQHPVAPGAMPETRTEPVAADPGPPPVPHQPTYTSPIEEVGK